MLNDRLKQLYVSQSTSDSGQRKGEAIRRRARVNRFGSSFQSVQFPKEHRAGILTHPYLLSAHAYHNNTSPIHRGVFLTRNVVGRALSPPPVAVAFKDDEFSPELTMREKITELTRDESCRACHSVINPLGFALESFDAVGRWRTEDNDRPIDTQSEYTTEQGTTLKVKNARDIAEFAVDSKAAHRAFVIQVFQHVTKRSHVNYPNSVIDELTTQFAEDKFNIQKLWSRIAVRYASDRLDRK